MQDDTLLSLRASVLCERGNLLTCLREHVKRRLLQSCIGYKAIDV